jgi:hypothetical protein
MVHAQLGDRQNWQHTDDLAMQFRGTYSSEFYRELRDDRARGGAHRRTQRHPVGELTKRKYRSVAEPLLLRAADVETLTCRQLRSIRRRLPNPSMCDLEVGRASRRSGVPCAPSSREHSHPVQT